MMLAADFTEWMQVFRLRRAETFRATLLGDGAFGFGSRICRRRFSGVRFILNRAPTELIRKLWTKMKLCAVSDSLGSLSFNEAAKASADVGLEALEIGMGNWSAAPHANLQSLLESKEKRREFLSVLERNGLSLAALNCSGNQLHPIDGKAGRFWEGARH
jgi:hypothetical protein